MSLSAPLTGATWSAWDHRLGLRASGLILYGALPASLGALGAFNPPNPQRLFSSGVSGSALAGLVIVAAVPMLMIFALVRQRLARWYLFADWLIFRSIVITTGIVLLSMAICLATGWLTHSYILVSPQDWWHLPMLDKEKPLVEALLLSAAYLVGSNTLFLAVVKDDGGLPFLPSAAEVLALNDLRNELRRLHDDPLARTAPPAGPVPETARLTSSITNARLAIDKLRVASMSFGRDIVYDRLCGALDQTNEALAEVAGSATFWSRYFGPQPADASERELRRRNGIAQLRGVKLHG